MLDLKSSYKINEMQRCFSKAKLSPRISNSIYLAFDKFNKNQI